jgi:hypothetical protein
MPVLEFKSECSEALFAQVEAMRGDMDRDHFLMEALTIGLGHLQEEVVLRKRQQVYDRLAMNTASYGSALELQRLKRLTPGAGVASFGRDVTRPKAAL